MIGNYMTLQVQKYDNIVILAEKNQSVMEIMTKFEKAGYKVSGVLPLLRGIVLELTEEQREEITKSKQEDLWKIVSKNSKDTLLS